jgi:CO dehydrogenase/acetyl-CoA synthase beta subunit
MPVAVNNGERIVPEPASEHRVADMAPLVERVREFLAERRARTSTFVAPYDSGALSRTFGYSEKKKGKPEIVLAENVARELGHPSTASRALVLITFKPELARDGRISIVGPDVAEMEDTRRYPLAQIVIVAVRRDSVPDPFELENTQFLMNRLPGYMVRSVPGKLWVRISKNGRDAGLSLKAVGSALIASYAADFPAVESVEVVFVTSSDDDVRALDQIATEAGILAGRHKKLVLGVDGEIECFELNCKTCDEKPVCDSLRDIVIKRRKLAK